MTVRDVVTDNLGYALLGGPAVAVLSGLAGASALGTAGGVACGTAAYGLGWVLAVRRSTGDAEPPSDADEADGRREGELEAQKGSYGGGGR
ncbi:hypothetical protein [Halorubrum ezzemoulense]|uniref:hypothetical protein n=1 Tax=Halorubrum ezzemoulense TaxID=337243 RepID=UPI00232DD37C|nr:hypothetical protein [Halorubrum ezzemoulense]MDB2241232.1 hypothetical protein [Halorubrum ezzemoulense]